MDNTPIQAMPLRIALLTHSVESARLVAERISSLPIIVNVFLSDDFESTLQYAIELVGQGKVVRLSANHGPMNVQTVLLMLSGLTAAKNKIHPHAYLAGFNVNAERSIKQSINDALAQAHRKQSDLSNQQRFNSLSETQKLSAFYQMVEAISAREIRSLVDERNVDDQDIDDKNAAQYWFSEPNKARVTTLSFASQASSSSLVLTQATGLKEACSILSPSRLFFIVTGKNHDELSAGLGLLNQRLSEASPTANQSRTNLLIELMIENLKQVQHELSDSKSQLTIVLQAASVSAMLREISAMSEALAKTICEQSNYKTPAGSCFSPLPNSKGSVAFVYPGVGTVYPGMLSDFYRYFPELYARLEREGDLKEILQSEKLYADNPTELSLSELAIAGVGCSYLLTHLLCQEFAIKPDFAMGYSKGEASMWSSLGVWKNPHALIEMTKTSPIFTTAISGELTAVRAAWELNSDEEIIWNSFVVRSDAATIEAVLPEFPHAYLAIIQGDTCVLAGCEKQCRELLKKLGKRGIAANRVTAMHTAPAWSQHKEVTEFYHQPLCAELPEHIRFISAAGLLSHNKDQPIEFDSQSIADSIADTYCSRLDFTALVQSARRHGARLFIEVGADRQTCTLIDKINRADKMVNTSATIATNAKGGEDILTLLKCIGLLLTHQIPVSLEPLIKGLEHERVIATTTLKGEPA